MGEAHWSYVNGKWVDDSKLARVLGFSESDQGAIGGPGVRWVAGWWVLACISTYFAYNESMPICGLTSYLSLMVVAESAPGLLAFSIMEVFISVAHAGGLLGIKLNALELEVSVAAIGAAMLAHGVTAAGAWQARKLAREQPGASALHPLYFPSVMSGLFALVARYSPIGAIGSPAYSVASIQSIVQLSAIGGLPLVNFFVLFLGSASARGLVGGARRTGLSAVVCACTVGFFGGARGLMAEWNLSSDARVHVAMLSTPAWTPDEVFANTEKEFSNGANLVVHTAGTDYGGEPPWEEYMYMLSNYDGAVLALDYTGPRPATETVGPENGMSWFTLLTHEGIQMAYARNHPSLFADTNSTDSAPFWDGPPKVVPVPLGAKTSVRGCQNEGQGCRLRKLTGSSPSDSIFPELTRALATADLHIQSASKQWADIGGSASLIAQRYVAVANGVTIIRATSEGISGAFDPLGNLLFQASSGYSGIFRFTMVNPEGNWTPYASIGGEVEIGVMVMGALALLLSIWSCYTACSSPAPEPLPAEFFAEQGLAQPRPAEKTKW